MIHFSKIKIIFLLTYYIGYYCMADLKYVITGMRMEHNII